MDSEANSKYLLFTCVLERVYEQQVHAGARGGQKRAQDLLELVLQAVVKHLLRMLGAEPQSTVRALNY